MPCVPGFVSVVFLSSLVACSSDDGSSNPSTVDAAVVDDAMDIDGSLGGRLPMTCTGTCAQMSLEAQFGAVQRTFDRSFFGMVAPAQSDSGNWEYYIESGSGDDANCPTMASPTPRFLLITTGVQRGVNQGDVVMPVATTLVDFEGDLLQGEPISRSETRSLTWVADDGCVECASGEQPDRADRMIAVDIEATFTGGSASGHVYATHCDSLDQL